MQLIKSIVLAGVITFGGAVTVHATEVTVKSGDTLWDLGIAHDVSYEDIMTASNINSDLILIGQTLTIPEGQIVKAHASETKHSGYSQSEIDILASLVRAEALGESMTGKIAVAAVVLNRVESKDFPDNLTGVIYQKGQFSPVANGSINQVADEESRDAVVQALNGSDPTNGATYFFNPAITSDHWIRTRPVTAVVGNHTFAK